MPASASARSSSLPAGPTNGRPVLSSLSPGCSPMKIARDVARPSPNTVCVPVLQSGQAVQPAAAARGLASEGLCGTRGAAVQSSVCAMPARYAPSFRDPSRHQRLRLRALEARLLPGRPAGAALAGALRAVLLDRRAERDLLPAAHRQRGGRMARRDAARLPIRGEGQPVSDAHEAPQGSRRWNPPLLRADPALRTEALRCPLAAAAADEQGGSGSPGDVPREAAARRPAARDRVPQRELVHARDLPAAR